MKLVLATFAMLIAFSANAASDKIYCGAEIKDTPCKNIPQNRREELGKQIAGGNPVAITNKGGNLFVVYTTGTGLRKCQVTSNVGEVKLSANPGDLATAYYVRNNELFDLRMTGDVSKNCPAAKKLNMNVDSKIGGTLLDFVVVPNANAGIVGIAKMTTGVLRWTDKEYRKDLSTNSNVNNARYLQLKKSVGMN